MINHATELFMGCPSEFEVDIHKGAYHWIASIETNLMTVRFMIEELHFQEFISALTKALKPFNKDEPSKIVDELRNIAYILSDRKDA